QTEGDSHIDEHDQKRLTDYYEELLARRERLGLADLEQARSPARADLAQRVIAALILAGVAERDDAGASGMRFSDEHLRDVLDARGLTAAPDLLPAELGASEG